MEPVPPSELQECLHVRDGKEGILQSRSAIFESTKCIFMFSLGMKFQKSCVACHHCSNDTPKQKRSFGIGLRLEPSATRAPFLVLKHQGSAPI